MDMKYIFRILFTMGLAFGLTACTEDAFETTVPGLPDKGEMSVNITFAMPDANVQTRSMVSGTENRVHTMQMVCFDANGLYLGIREASLVDQTTTGIDTGKIKGTVPQGTSRIHFIANRKLPEFLSFNVGTPEETVMMSEELSTIYNDANHQEVCYWGYHKESNADDMEAWLNPTSTPSKVYMIRDRAKIVFTYDSSGDDPEEVTVTKIEWLIHNGRERGYLAPAKTSWTNTGYWTNSTVEGHTNEVISKADINEYIDCNRYSLWRSADDNEDNNFDLAYQSSGTYTSQPQFLFEDDNTSLDDLKAILKVTYSISGTSKTVYHVLRLNDNDKVLYDVVRNRTYYINAKLLKPNVAFYPTLKDAIDGDEFVNAEVEVDREITDINDETYTLQIKLPTETTSIVLNAEGSNSDMQFVFRNIDLSEVTQDPTAFNVYWEKSQTFCSDPIVTYNSTTKQFVITTSVLQGKLTSQLQDEWIVVEHTASGLKRYIHVYVIDQFRFLTPPTLKEVSGKYVLSFQIPPTEAPEDNPSAPIYPVGLYPIDVKFATSTLKAYGLTQNGSDYGLFGVTVESTKNLTNIANFETNFNTPISSTDDANKTQWFYQQDSKWWDYWYIYSVKTYPTDGIVNIYLEDVRSSIKYASVANVGLFLNVKYFGKIYSLPVATTTNP